MRLFIEGDEKQNFSIYDALKNFKITIFKFILQDVVAKIKFKKMPPRKKCIAMGKILRYDKIITNDAQM